MPAAADSPWPRGRGSLRSHSCREGPSQASGRALSPWPPPGTESLWEPLRVSTRGISPKPVRPLPSGILSRVLLTRTPSGRQPAVAPSGGGACTSHRPAGGQGEAWGRLGAVPLRQRSSRRGFQKAHAGRWDSERPCDGPVSEASLLGAVSPRQVTGNGEGPRSP